MERRTPDLKTDFRAKAYEGVDPQTPEEYLDHARHLRDKRRYKEASIVLKDAAERFPNEYEVQLKHGTSLLHAFKPGVRNLDSEAQMALLRAINVAPDNEFSAKLQLAKLHIRKQEDTYAIALYDEILKADSKNVKALCGLGSLFTKHKNFVNAESRIHDAYDVDPNDPRTLNDLGHLYQCMGRANLARGCFGQAYYLSVEARDANKYSEERLIEIEGITETRFTNSDFEAVLTRIKATADQPAHTAENNAIGNPNSAVGG